MRLENVKRFVLLLAVFTAALQNNASGAHHTNILLIMADDLGYSDLGCYGSEIDTPNLDRLAEGGVRFSHFYNTARCWPTRASLLTGYYPQQVRRDIIPSLQKSGTKTGNRGTRQTWAKLLPKYLSPLGYRSYHSGKWHIDGMPIENGFDRSYYIKDQGRFFNTTLHYQDDKKLPIVPKGTDFYATTAIGNHAIDCLQEHASDHADQPFFHYLAFTAPHFPLHALPEDIAKYKGRYDAGWHQIRTARWKKMQAMGLLSGTLSAIEPDLGPPYDFPKHLEILGDAEVNRPVAWESLNEKQKSFQATKMAIHAAMIDRMDVMIGKVLDQIRAMDATDNTLILFLSDNGSSAEIMVRDDGHDRNAPMGSAKSYLCLGPGWSTTGNTPFRRHKTWTHEGGISTPLIAHWPARIKDKGSFRRQIGHVIDIVPTVLEIAAATIENASGPAAMPGKSLLRTFVDNEVTNREALWWFHDGHRALRDGDWKIVSSKNESWELFDLSNDRAEMNNLAGAMPDRIQQMEKRWESMLAEFTATAAVE